MNVTYKCQITHQFGPWTMIRIHSCVTRRQKRLRHRADGDPLVAWSCILLLSQQIFTPPAPVGKKNGDIWCVHPQRAPGWGPSVAKAETKKPRNKRIFSQPMGIIKRIIPANLWNTNHPTMKNMQISYYIYREIRKSPGIIMLRLEIGLNLEHLKHVLISISSDSSPLKP